MPRKAPLTDILLRNARPKDKAYKLSDGGGLFLQVQPNGNKLWRYGYRFFGKQKLLALGAYPDIGLAEAREKHAVAHKQVANGIVTPARQRRTPSAPPCSTRRIALNPLAAIGTPLPP